jgi:hypothetical protein
MKFLERYEVYIHVLHVLSDPSNQSESRELEVVEGKGAYNSTMPLHIPYVGRAESLQSRR